ncbi:hypothetical protein, partial [Escherichia coli]|uniref:hypothetical protein n=1 Tax=Escherichia coli TaxID=562 RepID=UPI000CABD339
VLNDPVQRLIHVVLRLSQRSNWREPAWVRVGKKAHRGNGSTFALITAKATRDATADQHPAPPLHL